MQRYILITRLKSWYNQSTLFPFVLIINNLHIVVFSVKIPCSLVGIYLAFGGTFCLYTTQRHNSHDIVDTPPRQPDS